MKPDVCCFLCKSQFGCMNSKCEHHVTARIADDADDRARRLYRDPTSQEAIYNIERANQTKPKAPAPGPFSYPNPRSK